MFGIYDFRFKDNIVDKHEYEKMGTDIKPRHKYDNINTYYKVYDPDTKLWGVAKVTHKAGERPHPSVANMVLPIEYDSIDADIQISDYSYAHRKLITIYGYKKREIMPITNINIKGLLLKWCNSVKI